MQDWYHVRSEAEVQAPETRNLDLNGAKRCDVSGSHLAQGTHHAKIKRFQQGLLSRLLRFESASSSIGLLQDTQMPGVLLWLNIPFKVSSAMLRPKLFLAHLRKKKNNMGPLDGHQTIEHAMACILYSSM